jgi:hypothetical protein
MKRFRWDEEGNLKFGRVSVTELPAFVATAVPKVLLGALSHAQVSVREAATKAFSVYLARSPHEVSLDTLVEVMARLTPPGAGLLGPYEAEGLLSVAVLLVKGMPAAAIHPNLDLYFAVFGRYLEHPASTVRQETSVLYKVLATKDNRTAAWVWAVLTRLLAGWGPDAPWQRQEGCLLACELIVRVLLTELRMAVGSSAQSPKRSAAVISPSPSRSRWLGSVDEGVGFVPFTPVRPSGTGATTTTTTTTTTTATTTTATAGGPPTPDSYPAPGKSFPPLLWTPHISRQPSVSVAPITGTPPAATASQTPSRASLGASVSPVPGNQTPSPSATAAAAAAAAANTTNSSNTASSTSSGSGAPSSALAGCLLNHMRAGSVRGVVYPEPPELFKKWLVGQRESLEAALGGCPSFAGAVADAEVGEGGGGGEGPGSPFVALFRALLRRTSEATSSARFEVKRISTQLLPTLTMTLLWFDLPLLVELWDRVLLQERADAVGYPATVLVGWLTVKYALRQAAGLQALIESCPPSTLQPHHHSDLVRVVWVVDGFRAQFSRLLPAIVARVAAGEGAGDEVFLVCMELMLSLQASFPASLSPAARREHASLTLLWLSTLQSKEEIARASGAFHTSLPLFVLTLKLPEMLSLLPHLLRFLRSVDDVDVHHSLLEVISRVWGLCECLLDDGSGGAGPDGDLVHPTASEGRGSPGSSGMLRVPSANTLSLSLSLPSRPLTRTLSSSRAIGMRPRTAATELAFIEYPLVDLSEGIPEAELSGVEAVAKLTWTSLVDLLDQKNETSVVRRILGVLTTLCTVAGDLRMLPSVVSFCQVRILSRRRLTAPPASMEAAAAALAAAAAAQNSSGGGGSRPRAFVPADEEDDDPDECADAPYGPDDPVANKTGEWDNEDWDDDWDEDSSVDGDRRGGHAEAVAVEMAHWLKGLAGYSIVVNAKTRAKMGFTESRPEWSCMTSFLNSLSRLDREALNSVLAMAEK